jgi:ATP diphosphatase
MKKPRYDFNDLQTLMARLRDPADGCPWDIKQTYRTIVPHTLEEVYEVIDTIEREDFDHLSEELGDLLFQVVFYGQIASDEERFTLDDVVHQLVEKLIYRHPHVFPDGTLESRASESSMSETEVSGQWEKLKAAKKKEAGVLSDVPHALPGLLRAKKLQSKAAKVGFDWPDVSAVIDKVHEELDELKLAISQNDKGHIEDELGDVLFVLANIARHTKIDPEQAVRRTNKKFEQRFSHVEESVLKSEKQWSDFSLEELDAFWIQAKLTERQ